MELNLITLVPEGATPQAGDEEINNRRWRVTGPHDPATKDLKFHCVSYVWGHGVEKRGSFFNCQRDISDQTRPALEAAIKAAEVIHRDLGGEKVEAFWIDALCIPQLEGSPRLKTLESMGFIYNAGMSVIITLKSSVWNIVQQASATVSPEPLSLPDMQILEADAWISRVWTYQELVNSRSTYFTTPASPSNPRTHVVVEATQFFNCVGYSFSRYKRDNNISESAAMATFPNLNVLEDTLLDSTMSGYLERPALGILSNISMRTFDPKFPQNRLLACIGALTKDASWGPPSSSLDELAEKVMGICEAKGDYSFVFTADRRSEESGKTWRPSTTSSESGDRPTHLIPVINWYIHSEPFGETQRGRKDESGFWLEGMVSLQLAGSMSVDAEAELDKFLWGHTVQNNPTLSSKGIFGKYDKKEEGNVALLGFLRDMGFRGCDEPQVCDTGLFFSQENLGGLREVELFAATSVRYYYGAPGLARWRDAPGGEVRHCSGVFVGLVKRELVQPLLMI
ncbi:hypothetical protein BKA61DRAFT_648324 [Leptodontidium sp. MPI-SDFR-AT-0119]|nr:hypothetical protein BKA61DRAFT_648324 [Leptodontidium sp. MPI-SDFR-AT-0119]